MSVSILIKNSCSTTGEGPHWDDPTQSLLYVDIVAGDVHRWNSATGEDQKLHLQGTCDVKVKCLAETRISANGIFHNAQAAIMFIYTVRWTVHHYGSYGIVKFQTAR